MNALTRHASKIKEVRMPLQKDLVSVAIAAYNQPHYLRRALQSIVEQDYRPIEVIVSDDCSPVVLKPVADEFAGYQNDLFQIRYYRSDQNRGAIDNFRYAVGQAMGRFLVPMPHDNRFVDRAFFAEAVHVMRSHADCHICYANASYEGRERKALRIPETICFRDGWTTVEGGNFIRLYRRGGMGWSQAMMIDHAAALSLGAYDEPFVVNGALSRHLGIAQDDMFAYVFLLSALGRVGLCEKPVCEIGTPPQSYSRSNAWRETKGKVKFVILYNIWRADLQGRYASDVKRMVIKQALQYTDHVLDRKIASYYRWSPAIVLLMGIGALKAVWRELRTRYKRCVNLIRPNTFKKT